MNQIKPVNTVVIGCGKIADLFIKNMKEHFRILNVVGCCDLNESHARAMAEKYQLKVLTQEEIINDPEIQIVVNLTPPKAHFSIISSMLKAKKHVYTEKVLAPSLEESLALCQLAEENQVHLCISPDTFLGSAIQNAKQLIDSNMLGQITACRCSLGRDYNSMAELIPYLVQTGGDIGIDVGIYHMTAMLYLLGPVNRATGFVTCNNPHRIHHMPSLDNFGVEYELQTNTVMSGSLEFKSGILGTMLFNSDTIMPEEPHFTIEGTEGVLTIDNPDNFDGPVMLRRIGQPEATVIPSAFGITENARGIGVAELAWSIRQNRTPMTDKAMHYHALETLLGIVQSSKTGQAYQVQSTFQPVRALPVGHIQTPFMNDWESCLV